MLQRCLGGLVKLKVIVVMAALSTLGTSANILAQSSQTPADNKFDAVFSAATSADTPVLAVLVRQGGRIVFVRGYGVRDLRTSVKIHARTNFRLASFTKHF